MTRLARACSAALLVAVTLAANAAAGSAALLNGDGSAIDRLVDSATEQTKVTRTYDPSYVRLAYPGGDVPADRGVCTDVIVRSFRRAGVDLQKEVHEDMRRNFSAYPRKWGRTRPDPNIDHRRVPNLMKFFSRRQKSLRVSNDPQNFRAGDVVAWDLGNGLLHVGLVVSSRSAASGNPLVVHNIGQGARMEDVLFAWRVIGHYRYF